LDKIVELLAPRLPFEALSSIRAVFRVGSHSHGTYIPPTEPTGVDDTDFMVVVIPPKWFKLSLRTFDGLQVQEQGYDIVVYEWSKFHRLLLKNNPNVIGCLFLDREDSWTPDGNILDAEWHRARIVSQDMYPAFIGYAKAQLYKMEHLASEGYMGQKRKDLKAKFGYDVKNAAHLVRLMTMAIETLETGRMEVRRPPMEAKRLIHIKQGGWTLEQVKHEAEALFDRAVTALHNTKLPAHPDDSVVNQLVIDGYLEWWHLE
jgi:predicted nucleotidyltransferase